MTIGNSAGYQSVGYIPKEEYDTFIENKDLYDKLGKAYPMHYVDLGGIVYQVSYTDPYTVIGYTAPDNTPVETPEVVATPEQVYKVIVGDTPASDYVPQTITPLIPSSGYVAPTPGVPYSPSNPSYPGVTPTSTTPATPDSTTTSVSGGMGAIALLVGAALLMGRKKTKRKIRR
jgi:hypothetical protein